MYCIRQFRGELSVRASETQNHIISFISFPKRENKPMENTSKFTEEMRFEKSELCKSFSKTVMEKLL